ncbi:hypothetical protein DGG96_13310 [Legionella qingyii]|uniref:Uncharacterized protein n=1 Tax=Legionella qingyii TaxID=2184757 RepID=A0A317TZJ7_9GAMM|nr:hypothetical protein [Legionella qingyii]PWY55154.1 hypothetical protein DGG96_13310 [Legionella qingyii]RUR25424.1 hypothetical protein ELY20_02920 [Legionella qingyii]RUR28465.1 hypothetical protein ELY16_03090 [Legionella qingyii]
MEGKIENPVTETPALSLFEFKTQLANHMKECAIFKITSEKEIEELELRNDHDGLIGLHEQIITTVKEQIAVKEQQLKTADSYINYTWDLLPRITSQIARQNMYIEELQLQLIKIKSLKFLFSLNPSELFEEALRNKPSALLIIQTPKLIAKIPNHQLTDMTSKDPELIKSLAPILAAREYSFETSNIFAELKQQVQTEEDKSFIVEKENAAIRDLLVKINKYLDKKIEQALNENTHPWALGYFGSRHKLNKGDKKVSVPQGIYELKGHLEQLNQIAPSEILTKMQNTLQIKNLRNQNESLLQQFKRLISYLFGYYQSQDTAEEYEYLDQVTAGKRSIS